MLSMSSFPSQLWASFILYSVRLYGDEYFEFLTVGSDGILMALVCTLHVKLHPNCKNAPYE